MDTKPMLATIKEPADLRNMSRAELIQLSGEIRSVIVDTVSHNGGHLASSLGVVELTLALHRVFLSPFDSIVWDVGHQCYAHKLISGRYKNFHTLRKKDGLSGFPKRSESVHDAFDTGHASTSISAALGMQMASRIAGDKRRTVAVIGDGALTGGLAYEALSQAGQSELPFVVVLNDNKMSIGPNVGALSKYLSRLTMKRRYQAFRQTVDSIIRRIPFLGERIYTLIFRMKRSVKALFYPENFFVDLGFEYVGPIDGHNLTILESVLTDVKKLNKPVVVHVVTRKGKGHRLAETDPGSFHGVSPMRVNDGLLENIGPSSFTEAFGNAVCELAASDARVVAVSAAMEKGTGLSVFKHRFPERFFDVGIAEAHALTFAAGMASRGLIPVCAIYSTFMQRAVDQVIHDIAIQKLPVIIAMDRAGLVPEDGETHQGLFDIALFRSIPGLAFLAPSSAAELSLSLRWAAAARKPVCIRYPKASCPSEMAVFSSPIVEGRGVYVRKSNASVLLAFTGGLYNQAQEASNNLAASGLDVDLYTLRFLTPIDEEYLVAEFEQYQMVVLLEEGTRSGGFGEYLATLILKHSLDISFLYLAVQDCFLAQANRDELLQMASLDAVSISTRILERWTVKKNTLLKAGRIL